MAPLRQGLIKRGCITAYTYQRNEQFHTLSSFSLQSNNSTAAPLVDDVMHVRLHNVLYCASTSYSSIK
jgi:hypothetical protein